MPQVLLVSDDSELSERCRASFAASKLSVAQVDRASAALAQARPTRAADMMILDHRLPDMAGTTLCRALRNDVRTRSLPLILLGDRAGELDAVVAFEVGADDYLCRPFHVPELALRARALARRSGLLEPAQATDRIDDAEGIALDLAAHEVRVNGRLVGLTLLEFRLLDTLLRRRGRLQSRDRLLEDVWGNERTALQRTVDTHVRRLRGKLGDAGDHIETVRGLGYRFRA